MTHREPDDLYDALRDRLADYGQEPPAPLWADIRAQLPPPVAPPQLRKRRRRASVLLLMLFLAVTGGLGWHWWQIQELNSTSSAHLATTSTTQQHPLATEQRRELGEQGRESSQQGRELSEQRRDSSEQGLVSSDKRRVLGAQGLALNEQRRVLSEQGLVSDTKRREFGADHSVLSRESRESSNKRLKSTVQGLASTSQSRASTRGMRMPIARRADAAARNAGEMDQAKSPGTAAVSGASNSAASDSKSASNSKAISTAKSVARIKKSTAQTANGTLQVAGAAAVVAPGRSVAGTKSPVSAREAAAYATKKAAAARRKAAPGAVALASAARQAPAAATITKPAGATSAPTISSSLPGDTRAASGHAGEALASSSPTSSPTENAADHSAPLSAEALARLQARAVALALAAGLPLCQPQLVAIAPEAPPKPFLARWAVQVLAGPALTYRQLSVPSGLSYPIMPNGVATASPSTTNTVAELERPALGAGAQINIRRALTQHWNLTAGLGYSEYATRLALQQVHNSFAFNFSRQDSSATSIHRRDVYRFVTLPVRLGYTWALTNRWQVGLLGGVDAALYVGGSSTEGSACACQTQTWGVKGSPYRSFSLGASLGAEVRYRLTGRWELLAQPTGSYLLTQLVPSTSAYYQRHLFGGTALLGAAYIIP